jgi:hypothetical protein
LYESGRKVPGADTLERVLAILGQSLVTSPSRHGEPTVPEGIPVTGSAPLWWPTASQIAAEIRHELKDGTPMGAVRFLVDGVNKFPDAAAHDDLRRTLKEPDTIGDIRWDTLLAAAIRYRLRQMGEPAPRWTLKPPLKKMWWPLARDPLRAINAFNLAPVELRRVGIFLMESEFGTV